MIDIMETTGSILSVLLIVIVVLLILGVIALILFSIIENSNQPTMTGIIISLIFGVLPLYLILCICGIMGEERNKFNR